MLKSRRLALLWSALAGGSTLIVLFDGSLPPKIGAGPTLVASMSALLRSALYRRSVRLAECPRDGQLLTVEQKQWGPRGNPLTRCPVDHQRYTVSRWTPFELVALPTDDRS